MKSFNLLLFSFEKNVFHSIAYRRDLQALWLPGHTHFMILVAWMLNVVVGGWVQADWPQFRGVNSSGIYQGKPIPLTFGPGQNEIWKLDLPAGHSSPCVWGEHVFVTAFDRMAKSVEVIAIGRRRGKIIWRRSLKVDRFEKGHPSFNPASSSPTTDGQRVVAYFGSYGLVCFSVTGEKLWEVRMPTTKSYAGNATSPAIIGEKVFLYRGNVVDHYVLAVDKNTGQEIWKVFQEEPFALELACTACPIVFNNKLILHSARSVQALDLDSGMQHWLVKCATTATSTPIVCGDRIVVAAWNKMGEPALRPAFPTFAELIQKYDRNGNQKIESTEYPILWIFHRPEGVEAPQNGATLRFGSVDANRSGKISKKEWDTQLKRMMAYRAGYKTHGLLSIPANAKGLVQAPDVKSLAEQGVPEVPSPIQNQGLVYFVKNGGLLTCVESSSGRQVYKIRTKGTGTHYASPVIANEYLYTISGKGRVSVVKLGREGKVVASNDMREPVYATPALHDGLLFIRTHSKLYAFGEN
ncbi:MAG: PQQ-binding-like beta-propeller repeat protein [Planctomycetota bacterium]|nr:PQQ-binding-like beta-propeller repeat protein [Planctomycetota bacterium]